MDIDFDKIDFESLDLFGSDNNAAQTGEEQPPEASAEDNPEQGPEAGAEENGADEYLFPEEMDNDTVPEKYRGKSVEDVIQMHIELEKLHGKYASREQDFAVLDSIAANAGNNELFQNALRAIISNDEEALKALVTPQSDDYGYSDSYEDSYQDDKVSKRLKALEAENEKLRKQNETFSNQNQQAQMKAALDAEIKSAIEYANKTFRLDMKPEEVIEFAQKNKDKIRFTSFSHAATELAARKVARAKASRGETPKGGPAMPHGNAKPTTPPATKVETWGDFRNSLKDIITKE